ncbi:MAG: phytanoyl-CoA dioxygenase family protein [Candidatus Latescibacterota bacterium]|nr:phytanoyl-CoA dioxygenase family protein [Candidatus Latescibacterota bacterium]
MRLTPEQLAQLDTAGYIVVECPFPRQLTDACLVAVDKVSVTPEQISHDAKKNHFSLTPHIADSYWSKLDHLLPFLQIELHPEIIELARQLMEMEDIYFRNGGINELAPGRGFLWHRDSEWECIELMHYFSNASITDGCLRVLPGSHIGEKERWLDEITRLRKERGYDDPPTMEGPADVEMQGELPLEVTSDHLIIRSSKILHATWKNQSESGRLMHHWLFRRGDEPNHRFTWQDYLTEELIGALSNQQKGILWLDRKFEIDEKYIGERYRELGKVSWGVL